jgi:hypothetical protein
VALHRQLLDPVGLAGHLFPQPLEHIDHRAPSCGAAWALAAVSDVA